MKYILAVTFLFLTGCFKKELSAEKTNNNEFNVELLFEHDGCKVYRFEDNRYRYFTNCKGSTQTIESCGKGCTRETEVMGGK